MCLAYVKLVNTSDGSYHIIKVSGSVEEQKVGAVCSKILQTRNNHRAASDYAIAYARKMGLSFVVGEPPNQTIISWPRAKK